MHPSFISPTSTTTTTSSLIMSSSPPSHHHSNIYAAATTTTTTTTTTTLGGHNMKNGLKIHTTTSFSAIPSNHINSNTNTNNNNTTTNNHFNMTTFQHRPILTSASSSSTFCSTPGAKTIEDVSLSLSSFSLNSPLPIPTSIRSAPVTPATPTSFTDFETAKKEFQEHFLQRITKKQLFTKERASIRPVASLPNISKTRLNTTTNATATTAASGHCSSEDDNDLDDEDEDIHLFGTDSQASSTKSVATSSPKYPIPNVIKTGGSASCRSIISLSNVPGKQHGATDGGQALVANILSSCLKKCSKQRKNLPKQAPSSTTLSSKIHKSSKTKTSLLDRRRQRLQVVCDFNTSKQNS